MESIQINCQIRAYEIILKALNAEYQVRSSSSPSSSLLENLRGTRNRAITMLLDDGDVYEYSFENVVDYDDKNEEEEENEELGEEESNDELVSSFEDEIPKSLLFSSSPKRYRYHRLGKRGADAAFMWNQVSNPDIIQGQLISLLNNHEAAFWNMILSRSRFGTVQSPRIPLSSSSLIHPKICHVWEEIFDQAMINLQNNNDIKLKCMYIDTPIGCQAGNRCQFLHESTCASCAKPFVSANPHRRRFCSRNCERLGQKFSKSFNHY